MPTISSPITSCAKCGGPVFDNRENLKTPKSPHFRCRDKDCAEAYWLAKPKEASAPKAAPAPSGPVNWPQVQRDYYAAVYCASHGLAKALGCKLTDLDQSAVQAGTATVLIQLEKQGHRLGTLAPKPAVPEPPKQQPLDEVPAALQDDHRDDLPW